MAPFNADSVTLEVETGPQSTPSLIGAFDLQDDAHRAALEDNPDQAELPSWSTILAVLVGLLLPVPFSLVYAKQDLVPRALLRRPGCHWLCYCDICPGPDWYCTW
jgi:hypothetical protein